MANESNQQNQAVSIVKKRLLFVITLSEFGGAQRFLYNLIGHLDKSVYEITLAAGDGPGDGQGSSQDEDFLISQMKSLGIAVRPLKNLKRDIAPVSDLKAVLELKKIIGDFKPDTVFLNSSKAGFVGSLAVQFTRSSRPIKVIYRIGGWTFNDPWSKWKKLLFVALEKISASWKDIIIVNSRRDFDQARDLNLNPRGDVVLIANGLDVYKTVFLPKDEARLKLLQKISGQSGKIFQVKTLIGTIANFYPSKGLEYLIEAVEYFKNHPEAAFVVIGDGPLREGLKLKVKSLKLEGKVFLIGRLPDAAQYLPAFDIFVLPSLKEGFPWTVLEAMAAKIPVVATAVGALPEVIEDGKNGMLAEPANPAQLAKKIKELLADELRRQSMGLEGHQTVLLKFSLEKMVNQVEALL